MMRTGKVVVVAALLALASGCGGSPADGNQVATARSGTPTTGASSAPAESDEDAPLKFAQCMREHGMTWFPDPDPNGRTAIRTPKDMDPKKFEAAQEACRQFAPDGGDAGVPDPEAIEMARQMAKCMRANGVPDFPDPQPDGSIRLDRDKLGTGPGEEKFDRADEKCAQYRPEGRERGTDSGGGPA
jgi:hypothetical protein